MRAAYLAQDRPDISFATRELAKGMANPSNHHLQKLKRVARYLKHRPRLVQEFPYQKDIQWIEGWCDSDHAGCIRTRKSTSGGAVMIGKCSARHYAKGQGVIALSSGEAEYYGLVSVVAALLGSSSLAADWGIRLKPLAFMDATAGISIGSRRGPVSYTHLTLPTKA